MIVTAVFATTLSVLTTFTLAIPTLRTNIAAHGNPGLCIVPAGNAVGDGTPVQLAPCTDGGSPWAHDGTRAISLTGTNQCLDVTDGVDGDGTRLQTWECTGGPNQQFSIFQLFPQIFYIEWVGSHKCLDVTDGEFSPGTPIQLWDCIGNSLRIAPCTAPTPSQQRFTPSAGGFHVFGGWAIDITDGDQSNGNKLQIWQFFSGNTNQRWFYDAAKKAIRLTVNPNKCIDVTDGHFIPGTKLQIWDCYFGPNQQFTAVHA